MDIAIFGFSPTIEALETELRTASDQGFSSFWIPQVFGLDVLTAIAAAARSVPEIELGTSVIPTYPRHPMMLAQQALTTQQAIGGRLALGIGLSHQPVVEGMWGIDFSKPVRHMREYLTALMPLLHDKGTSFGGEVITSRGQIDIDAPPPQVLVAALGPQMLKVTGRLADGTITWMVGANTLADLTVPTITAAAEAAGRPAPRIVTGVPICLTDDVEEARNRAATEFAIYGQLPSYRAMLDREGLEGPADLAIIGSADQLAERVDAFRSAGVTTLAMSEFGTRDERAATREFLRTLL
ncbi:MAG: LLM class F420-dependent oxidoreductase [Actinomycetia bacterium]|nr:LLM class F420-dependent oxidoreductase [Actinomycetes bacterium]MCP4960633.1 LLM class F420-dependent oxidoreductase [Actinomycetes bacterium]